MFADIPIFSLLDADERAVLAEQVELRRFAPRQRIYRRGRAGRQGLRRAERARCRSCVIDDDNQEVVIDAPGRGEMFGLASMLSDSPHRTTAVALEETTAIEIDAQRPRAPCCSASRWPGSTC